MIWYARPVALVAVARKASFVFVVPGRGPISLDGLDVDAMSDVLAATGLPIARDELVELCGGETIDRLVELGVLDAGTQEELAARFPPLPTSRRCGRVVVGLTGAIRVASYLGHLKAVADVVADEVDVVVSEGAAEFVRPELFGYYGWRVWTEAHAPAHGIAVPHKHLAEADLVLVAPASASAIQRLASGACSDLISLVVALTRAPVVVAPSMNPHMWRHPPIARNVAQLRADGMWVIEPGVGAAVADRDDRGVGASTIDPEGLVRVLDTVLTEHAAGR